MVRMKNLLEEYLYIAIGSFVFAFATTFFLVPYKISTGGISGIATLLHYCFQIPLSVTALVLNLLLFLAGYRTLRKTIIVKSFAGIVLYSGFLEITQRFGSYQGDTLLAVIFGGILVGIGVGMVVFKEASTGGSDFAAIMLHKAFPGISIATFVLWIDSIIILVSGIVFRDFSILLYSEVALYICSKVMDYILIRGNYAKAVYVISAQNEQIANGIMHVLGRGVTSIYSKGAYTQMEQNMLMCVIRNKEIPGLLSLIKAYDKSAFTIVTEASVVYGEGFKAEL